MSWVTNKATLVSTLTNLGYKEIPIALNLEEAPLTLMDKGYTLSVKTEAQDITNSAQLQSDIVTIQVSYIVKSNAQKDVSVDDFRTLITSIKTLPAFAGFTEPSEPSRVEQGNNRYLKYQISFYYGLHTC